MAWFRRGRANYFSGGLRPLGPRLATALTILQCCFLLQRVKVKITQNITKAKRQQSIKQISIFRSASIYHVALPFAVTYFDWLQWLASLIVSYEWSSCLVWFGFQNLLPINERSCVKQKQFCKFVRVWFSEYLTSQNFC